MLFTEYVEGSGNNKALEIFNGRQESIDLAASEFRIEMYFNGRVSPDVVVPLSGTVLPGGVYVVVHGGADPEGLRVADEVFNSVAWFNGNDALVLRAGEAMVDSFGQLGVDPGAQWRDASLGTQNQTLRRKATVVSGDADATDEFAPSLGWDAFQADALDGLGRR